MSIHHPSRVTYFLSRLGLLKLSARGLVFLTLAGCDDKAADSANAPGQRPTKASVRTVTSSTDARVDSLWTRWEKSRSAVADLSLPDLLAMIERTRKLRYSSAGAEYEAALAELASRDPKAALALLDPKDMRIDEPGFHFVAGIIAELDPAALQDWLKGPLQAGNRDTRSYFLAGGLSVLARKDLASAIDFLKSNEWKGMATSGMVNEMFLGFWSDDPAGAERIAAEKLTGEELDMARYNIAIGARDPRLMMEIALKLNDPRNKGYLLGSALSKLLDSDEAGTIALMKSLDGKDLQGALLATTGPGTPDSPVLKLARSNPAYLQEILGGMVITRTNSPLFIAAVESLAIDRPEDVGKLLVSIPDGPLKEDLLYVNIQTLAGDDPGRAAAEAAKMKEGANKEAAYRAIGYAVTPETLDEFARSLGNLPDADRKSLYSGAISRIASTNPKDAAERIADPQTPLSQKDGKDLSVTVGSKLQAEDIAYADEWISRLPKDRQTSAMYGLSTSMAKTDVEGLARKLTAMEKQDHIWVTGVRVLITNIEASDPEMAKSWKDAIVAAASSDLRQVCGKQPLPRCTTAGLHRTVTCATFRTWQPTSSSTRN